MSDNVVMVILLLVVVFGSCRVTIERTPTGGYRLATAHGLGCDCRNASDK